MDSWTNVKTSKCVYHLKDNYTIMLLSTNYYIDHHEKKVRKNIQNLHVNYDLACRGLANISPQLLANVLHNGFIELGFLLEGLPSLQTL